MSMITELQTKNNISIKFLAIMSDQHKYITQLKHGHQDGGWGRKIIYGGQGGGPSQGHKSRCGSYYDKQGGWSDVP